MPHAIEIFRAGTHTAMNGRQVTISPEDVAAMAASYDPAAFEAPVVVGHPKHDAPAYAWVKGLKVGDNATLIAEIDDLDPQFAELVAAGRFKKVSASFYEPSAAANPKPGAYTLKHVGFLGAAAPAVKGLKSVSFSADEEAITIEFGAAEAARAAGWGLRTMAGVIRRLREFLVEKEGVEVADRVIPGWDVDALQADAAETVAEIDQRVGPAFAETIKETEMTLKPEDLAAREAALKEREAKLAADTLAFAEEQKIKRHGENAAQLDALITTGKLAPALRADLLAFMDGLDHAGVLAFSEGAQKSPLAFFRELLGKTGQVINFAEVAKADGAVAAFAELNANGVAAAIAAYQKDQADKGRIIDAATAATELKKKG